MFQLSIFCDIAVKKSWSSTLFIYFIFTSNQLSEMIKEAFCYPGKVGIISMFVDVCLRLTDVDVFTL